jgi:hypothetical protein
MRDETTEKVLYPSIKRFLLNCVVFTMSTGSRGRMRDGGWGIFILKRKKGRKTLKSQEI